MSVGYSEKPLIAKLDMKDGQRVAFVGLPEGLTTLACDRAFVTSEVVAAVRDIQGRDLDAVHLFTDSRAILAAALPDLIARITPSGMIWVSWPKKASKRPTDLTEDVIRDLALTDVLVDVKVCSVDAVWSGLKLVIRKEYRP